MTKLGPMGRYVRRSYGAALALLILFGTPPPGGAATLPPGFAETLVAGGLDAPTAMALAPDGRIFICEQGGRVRVVKNSSLLPDAFVTLTVDSSGERGLLGITFDPEFESNHFVYVYYTATTPTTHNRLSRFTAAGDVAVPDSEVVILELENLSSATNHNGGAIHFGPDGRLYVAVGDNANGLNAQSLATRLGKVLRLNKDGSIPADNPFFTAAAGVNRAIWALGLRNPFTFSFHAGLGTMMINDVGQTTWEEINDGLAGANYGWPETEGPTDNPAYVTPRHAYAHGSTSTTGCAITGGTFYDPDVMAFPPAYWNSYFFADLCSGWIGRLDLATNTVTGFATGIAAPVDLKVSRDGALYYLSYSGGAVFRVSARQSHGSADDLDGDSVSDPVVFRPATGTWYVLQSSTSTGRGVEWGVAGDVPVAADYDGDGVSDIAVFRPATSQWFVLRSTTGLGFGLQWGAAGDSPVPADYDGDGKTDVAVYRPSTGVWYIVRSSTGTAIAVSWGQTGDLPVPADFDGDGKADPTVFRPSSGTWYQLRSTTGSGIGVVWGQNGDTPLAGDYDGDGKADPTMFRSSTGIWYQLRSTTGTGFGVQWGAPGDVPIVGDYDGDGKADPTVFRPSTAVWYQLRSTTGSGFGLVWGVTGDLPM